MKLTYDIAQDTSEDGTVRFIFDYFTKHPPVNRLLVDVGAYGKDLSNTFALLSQGWKGLLIDANPDRFNILTKDFSGLDVEILNIGIGDKRETLPLYIHKGHGRDAQEKDRDVGGTSFFKGWFGHWETGETKQVMIFPLADVLNEKKFPKDFDLLSVDTEGFDKRIIEHLFNNSFYRPRLIVAEQFSFSPGFDTFKQFSYTQVKGSNIGPWGTVIFSNFT